MLKHLAVGGRNELRGIFLQVALRANRQATVQTFPLGPGEKNMVSKCILI
jgi:hypothetical protein